MERLYLDQNLAREVTVSKSVSYSLYIGTNRLENLIEGRPRCHPHLLPRISAPEGVRETGRNCSVWDLEDFQL